FHLRFSDSGNDGITGGGYILSNSSTNQRLIDNRNNFTSGSISQIANGEGFCLPLGTDRLITVNCDKLDWLNNEYVIANDNPAVTAVWNSYPANSAQRANSGYEMWWFNPNGGYSFRRIQSHATVNGITASATRACNFKINAWTGNQLQNQVLYNVRVRSRVNTTGVPANTVIGQWGSTCRFMVDPVRAQCPLTKLLDQPGNQFFSCGSTRTWGAGNYVHARPVTKLNNNNVTVSANRYQFRFRIPAENFSVTRTSAAGQYFLQLNWSPSPLEPGKTYNVDVRASFDNGVTWCTDFEAPVLTDPWGDVCKLTIASVGVQSLRNIRYSSFLGCHFI
ncbi:MAG TPA: hypothetical protein PK760_14830, partial [Flavobacteriales bacterium]|nr:hypothetical protein [Flavobacteriales bacterium]